MNELEATETLGVFLDQVWLPSKQGRVEVATYDQYAWAVRCHVKPLVGALPLGDLTPEVLDKWVDALITADDDGGKARLGRTSARTVRKILSMALDDAVQRGLLAENPVEGTRPPSPAPKPAQQDLGWTVDEAGRFLTVASTHRLAALFHLGLVTGLRRGELLALRWLDVNVEECYLYVRQQLAIERNRPVLKPVGSDHGDRIVTFGPTTADALARHRGAQSLERDRAGDAWTESGLVFTTRTGGWVDPSNVGRLMDGLIDAAGVPRIPPKGMRHTAHRVGRQVVGDERLMEERLGRAEADDHDLYATLSDQHRAAGERLDQAFAPAG
ncbi:MAG TPA: tyrosine-type recombinase/integrase [Acidimicrobiales bacterium]|jgi:integrase|nr:tyrosine-type recombinase/integrase [Acidimicrobiales bacterium]